MTKLNEVYKCEICGNITEMVHTGAGELVCCGQPMKLRDENTEDAVQEKHVPVIEKTEKGIKIKVGSVEHPMTEEHYIEWIEIICCNKSYKHFLKPGDKPEAEFCCVDPSKCCGTDIIVRAYCNLHGLWKA
jgi:superoxide reductase